MRAKKLNQNFTIHQHNQDVLNASNAQNNSHSQAQNSYNNYLTKMPLKQFQVQHSQSVIQHQNGVTKLGQNLQEFQNIYISHSPQPNSSLKAKKNNLMIYGYNNKPPHLQGNHSDSINIKSQKQLMNGNGQNMRGDPQHQQSQQNGNQNLQQLKQSKNVINIKKEKERIHQLLLQNSQGINKIIAPSSRNSKEDQLQLNSSNHQSGVNNLNGGTPLKMTSSFKVQPSNIHELNSFLNNNHYFNVQDQFGEKKKNGINLIQRKAPTSLEKSNDYSNVSQIQNGLISVNKQKDIKFMGSQDDQLGQRTLDNTQNQKQIRDLASNSDEYNMLQNGNSVSDLDNHPKSTLHKHGPTLNNTNTKSLLNQDSEHQQKSHQELPIHKRPTAAEGQIRHNQAQNPTEIKISDHVNDLYDQKIMNQNINNSFTEKKGPSSKWIPMNSKHVRNKSEAKVIGGSSAVKQKEANVLFNNKERNYSEVRGQKEQVNAKNKQDVLNSGIVERYSCKTRQGYIPNTKKTNQDAYILQRDFAGIKGCWLMGVFDGHGVNGHLVSDFCKRNIPIFLSSLINAGQDQDNTQNSMSAQNKKRKNKNSRHFLPPLVNQGNKKDHAYPYEDQSSNNGNTTTNNFSNDSNNIQQWLIANPQLRDQQVKEAFKQCQEKLEFGTKIDCMFSGTTAVVVIAHNNTLICANSGDSRAILCSQNSAGIWSYTALNKDHKPDDLEEANRVRKCNGRIEQSRLMPGMPGYNMSGYQANQPQFFGPKRVWLKHKQVPGLAMTRSLGDLVAKSVGVTHEPEIKVINNLTQNDKFIVLASDGLWDRIPNDEVTRIVANPFYERGDPEGAVQFLVKESAERWQREQGMVDDITIIIVFINPNKDSQPQIAAYYPESGQNTNL